jgi:cytidine deaminase
LEAADRFELIRTATEGRESAYAPYSKFRVGAAVRTAAGHQEIVAVAVVTSGGHAPCGACRQVLSEFGPAMDVLIVDADDPTRIRTTTLDKLLPQSFGGAALQ